jgi:hypothetical protein
MLRILSSFVSIQNFLRRLVVLKNFSSKCWIIESANLALASARVWLEGLLYLA